MKTQKLQELIHPFHRPGENPNFDLMFDLSLLKGEPDLKIRSSMVEASVLVGREIKIENGPYVKVITVKMNNK